MKNHSMKMGNLYGAVISNGACLTKPTVGHTQSWQVSERV